jgi:hypothetical protein
MSQMQPYEQRPLVPPVPQRDAFPHAQPYALATDQRSPSGAVVAIAWVSAVLTLAYLLPWAIAVTRGRSNMAAIGVLNLLLGWSLIGWVAALVMACQAHAPVPGMTPVNVVFAQQFPHAQFAGPVPPATPHPPAGWYPSPDGAGHQYWDGTGWTGHRAP